MSREAHVQFWESTEVKSLCATRLSIAACAVVCLFTTAHAGAQTLTVGKSNGAAQTNVVSAHADDVKFSTLYKFEAPAATTFTSPLGVSTRHPAGAGSGRRHLRDDQCRRPVCQRRHIPVRPGRASVHSPAYLQRAGCELRECGRSHAGHGTDARPQRCDLRHGLFRRPEWQWHDLRIQPLR